MTGRSVRRGLGGLIALVWATIAPGCSSIVSNRVYTHEELDLGAIRRVSVLPFDNYSSESRAGERVTAGFVTELIALRLFDVVDPAQTEDFLSSAKLSPQEMGAPELKKMKEALGVDAVVYGSADEYAMQTIGTDVFPVVTLSVRLVDVQTGTVLWRDTVSGTGDPRVPILGLGRIKTLPEMTQIVCSQIARTLSGK